MCKEKRKQPKRQREFRENRMKQLKLHVLDRNKRQLPKKNE